MNKGLAVIGLLIAVLSNTWAACPDYLNVEVRALRSDKNLISASISATSRC